MGVHVHRKVRPGPPGRGDEGGHHVVVVRPAGVLGADGHLGLRAAKAVAHAAHVHADGLAHPRRDAARPAVAHLFKHGDMVPYPPRRAHRPLGHPPGQPQQDGHRELIVQKAALDIARWGDDRAGVKAHDVPGEDAQGPGVLRGGHLLVQHYLHLIPAALGVGIAAVDVDGGVLELERPGVSLALPGIDAHVLRLGVVGLHAPQGGQAQAAPLGDLRHHAAQGVGVGLQQKAALLRRLRVQAHQHAPLAGAHRRKAQGAVALLHPGRRPGGVARGAVNGKKLPCLFHDEIHSVGHENPSQLRCRHSTIKGAPAQAAPGRPE